MTLQEYLSQPCNENPFEDWTSPFPPSYKPTLLELFAALLAMDGGGYGVHATGGLYGSVGLRQQEAFAWWDLRSFVKGWLAATDGAEAEWLQGAITAEHVKRAETMRAAR